ncbi:hypothetical protein ACFQYP_27085 [Nonomuraea antimicrobica]
MDEQTAEQAAILTVNAGSSSLRLDLVQGAACWTAPGPSGPSTPRRPGRSWTGSSAGTSTATSGRWRTGSCTAATWYARPRSPTTRRRRRCAA